MLSAETNFQPFSSSFNNNRSVVYRNECCGLVSYEYISFAPNVYIYEKMIDDCFDALKSINTMERDAGALASLFQQIRTQEMKL